MSASVQNLEEAATIASEFIYSLDNLPNEVQHLLQEIKHRETKSQELQQEIDKDSARYIRHQVRSSSVPTSPSASTAPSPAPNGNKSHLPAKIAASYAEIHKLADEKCALSQRLMDLVVRTRERLDADLVKVRILQGDVEHPKSMGTTPLPGGGGDGYSLSGRNPVLQIGESLRNALGSPSIVDGPLLPLTPAHASVSVGPSATKKRRVTASASVKLTSPAPTPTSTSTAAGVYPRSRLSRQIHPPRPVEDDADMDAEGEDDAEGDGEDGDGEDEKLYCFCQKQSYGDMIACDNEGSCPYEWFHLSCVGIKLPIPEKWYCSDCKNKGVGTSGRKGRKK